MKFHSVLKQFGYVSSGFFRNFQKKFLSIYFWNLVEEQGLRVNIEPISNRDAIKDTGSTTDTIPIEISQVQSFEYTLTLKVDGEDAPGWITLDSENDELTIDYSQITYSVIGTHTINVTVMLDDFTPITNETIFDIIVGVVPVNLPIDVGDDPDETIGAGRIFIS